MRVFVFCFFWALRLCLVVRGLFLFLGLVWFGSGKNRWICEEEKELGFGKGYTSLKIRFAVEEGVIKELKGKGTRGWRRVVGFEG